MFSYRVDKDPLLEYAANLLAALRDLDPGSNMFDFMIFVVRSCLPNITHRLGADQYAFKRDRKSTRLNSSHT